MKRRLIIMCSVMAACLTAQMAQAGEPSATDPIRKTMSLDQGGRFKEGWFTLPERTPVVGWRYRLDARGEASADVMAAPGVDTSGPEWAEGSKFDARKGQKEESILQGWLAVGDMNRKDDFMTAWFRAEVVLQGGADWQTVVLNPANFLNAANEPLTDWSTIKELRLGAQETLRGKSTKELGGKWQGAPPEFRNLRWVVGS
jgi:hypothetical protein